MGARRREVEPIGNQQQAWVEKLRVTASPALKVLLFVKDSPAKQGKF
jgi:hypothetical protein